MTTFALTDATTYIGSYDMTGDGNEISLEMDVEELDSTVFGGGGYRGRKGGLKTVSLDYNGFYQAGSGTIDDATFPNLGSAGQITTITPQGAEGGTAYMLQTGRFKYELFGEVGILTPFSLGMMHTDPIGIVRGQLTKAKGNVSATGATGTALTLPAVGATEYLYATFHVFSAGTTITAVVESDDSGAFGSATTQISFTGVTSAGGTWGTRVAGPITDTSYRLRVTAITGTFQIACAVGVR